jgi:transcriptional regulator with XRE-family HTH domain
VLQDEIALTVLAELQRRQWTIQMIARLSGVHRSVLSRWLSGRRGLRTADLVLIMRVLDLQITRRSDP